MCYIGLRILRILKNAWWFWRRLFCNFPISKLAIIMLWMLNSSRWESHKQHTTLSLRIFYIPTYIALQVLATYTLFFISNAFISNVRLNLAKNKAKAKQHPEAELLLFENYSLSSFTLSAKNNRRHSKKCTKMYQKKCVCFNPFVPNTPFLYLLKTIR